MNKAQFESTWLFQSMLFSFLTIIVSTTYDNGNSNISRGTLWKRMMKFSNKMRRQTNIDKATVAQKDGKFYKSLETGGAIDLSGK